jgi:predicted lipase
MLRDDRWQAVLDPGSATDFFAARAGQAMGPVGSGWDRELAWWCSEISRTVYRRDGRAEFFARAGLCEQRFFDRGSTQAALLQRDDVAVLVFRGTSDLRDWLINVRVAPTSWPEGGRVHDGFARALQLVFEEVGAELQRLMVPTIVTGHSLGGALATLAASCHPFRAAYTFGAPRVGDAEFWTTLRCPLHRVVNGRDLVPRLPPHRLGYVHGGSLQLIGVGAANDDEGDAEDLGALDRSPGERRWFDPHPTLADHAPANYSAAICS